MRAGIHKSWWWWWYDVGLKEKKKLKPSSSTLYTSYISFENDFLNIKNESHLVIGASIGRAEFYFLMGVAVFLFKKKSTRRRRKKDGGCFTDVLYA
jgi:hypothetical protein